MSVNGIGTARLPMAGYETRKAEKSSTYEAAEFMEVVAEKAVQNKAKDYDEKAFDVVGPNAPQEVRDAWMAAANEVNANGMGIKRNGMLSHISQMMVQRLNKQLMGDGNVDSLDVLGNTTESAIQETKQALCNLDHPVVYIPKSIEVQQACMKEREFYVAFLENLEKLLKNS